MSIFPLGLAEKPVVILWFLFAAISLEKNEKKNHFQESPNQNKQETLATSILRFYEIFASSWISGISKERETIALLKVCQREQMFRPIKSTVHLKHLHTKYNSYYPILSQDLNNSLDVMYQPNISHYFTT